MSFRLACGPVTARRLSEVRRDGDAEHSCDEPTERPF